MLFNWEDYRDLAIYLLKTADKCPSKEAAYRTAVSRSFFAAYCFARNQILALDPCSSCLDPHILKHNKKLDDSLNYIYNYYFENEYKNAQEYEDKLRNLRKWQSMCDIMDDLDDNQSYLMAKNAIKQADSIIKDLYHIDILIDDLI